MNLVFPNTRTSRLACLVLKGRNSICQTRCFHASRPHQLVNEALLLSHAAFETVHIASGLSWGSSLLLTGALVRVLFLPLEVAFKQNKRKFQLYQPLLQAWRSEFLRQAKTKEQKGELPYGPKAVEWWVEKQVIKKREHLQLKYGYRSWVGFLPLAAAPAWIINVDVLRRMVGMKQSMLSWFMNEDGDIDSSFIPPDPSLALEGFLWIPHLTIADPLSVLPITLWGLIFSQIYLRFRDVPSMSQRQIQNLSTVRARLQALLSTRFKETSLLVGILFGPWLIAIELPSALILYWIATSGTLVLERLLVNRIVGIGKTLKPTMPLTARLKGAKRHVAGSKQ
jgi:membrane protein insertase Oxa1/YidC/SpoIIIJ